MSTDSETADNLPSFLRMKEPNALSKSGKIIQSPPMLLNKLTLATTHAPLVVFVHGRGGNLEVMRPFQRVVPAGCSILFIQAPIPDTDIGGFSWWLAGEGAKPRYESGRELVSEIVTILEQAEADPERIIGIGFSQGGAILSLAIQDEPGFFSGIAILASFALESRQARVDEASARATKVLMINGDADQIVPLPRAQSGLERLTSRSFSAELLVEPGVGHKIGSRGLKALELFVREQVAS